MVRGEVMSERGGNVRSGRGPMWTNPKGAGPGELQLMLNINYGLLILISIALFNKSRFCV